jgi:lysophospholipase L1-like esterase
VRIRLVLGVAAALIMLATAAIVHARPPVRIRPAVASPATGPDAGPGGGRTATDPAPDVAGGRLAPGPAEIPADDPLVTAARLYRIIRVMPLGDSITDGVGSLRHNGYRAVLRARLAGAGIRIDYVGSRRAGPRGADNDNEGHPGWTITRLGPRVDRWLIRYRPQVVLLHIGTNDVTSPVRAVGAPGRLSALIDRIRRRLPRARIFVAQLIGSRNDAVQQRVDRFNAAVPGVVAAKDHRVHLVDQRAVTTGYLRDALHPNDAGYARMAATWYQALRPVLS